jgi:hypothetical protein
MLSPAACALELPEIPDSARVLSVEEVKNYWVNKLPEPREPTLLKRDYQSLIVDYHRQVGERHRLIQAIRAGEYDDFAKIVMLWHNIQAYLLRGEDAKAEALSAELEELEAIAQREEAERANEDRLERLIAATERLAAAIENNGGIVPDGVDELIPFERDADDDRSLLTYLYDEIAICRQPVIVHYDRGQGRPDRPGGDDGSGSVHPPNSYPEGDPRGAAAREAQAKLHPRPSLDLVPPVVLPNPPGSEPIPTRPQPQSRPARAPAPSPLPSQPAVRPVRAPAQPQVRPAR